MSDCARCGKEPLYCVCLAWAWWVKKWHDDARRPLFFSREQQRRKCKECGYIYTTKLHPVRLLLGRCQECRDHKRRFAFRKVHGR